MPAAQRFKQKTGVTLVEILIAAGVLSLFMTAVFSVYRSGSRGFVIGTWRAEEQKKLQTFISALTRDLSQANSDLTSISSDGTRNVVMATPVYINKSLYSFATATTLIKANSDKWLCLMAFSISYPHIEANATLMAPVQPGKWSGVSIWVKDHNIRYVRTGSPGIFSSVPVGLPGAVAGFPGPGVVGAGLNFLPDTDQNTNHTYDLSLEELAMVGNGANAAAPSGIEFIFKSARYENGNKTAAEMTQNAVVELASQTVIVTF